MLALKDLITVSVNDIWKSPWDDFSQLSNLNERNSIIIGYRGNVYQIDLRIMYPVSEYYFYECMRMYIMLQDPIENQVIGTASYDKPTNAKYHVMPQIRKEIEEFIVQSNIKATDFYK